MAELGEDVTSDIAMPKKTREQYPQPSTFSFFLLHSTSHASEPTFIQQIFIVYYVPNTGLDAKCPVVNKTDSFLGIYGLPGKQMLNKK